MDGIDLTKIDISEQAASNQQQQQQQQQLQPRLLNTPYNPLGWQPVPAGPRPPLQPSNPQTAATLTPPPWSSRPGSGTTSSSGRGSGTTSSGWGSGSSGGGSRPSSGSGSSSSSSNGYRQPSPGYQTSGYAGRGGFRSNSPGDRFGGLGPRFDSPGGWGGRGGGPGSRPGSAGGPPPWLKQGCWLLPRPGSSDAAAFAAAGAAQGDSSSSDRGVVTIMRGLPGSGKSTRAAQIAAEARQAAAAAAAGAAAGDAAVSAALISAESSVGTGDGATAAAAAVVVAVPRAADASPTTVTGSDSSSSASGVVAIHSTDSFFITASGLYQFDPELLGVNHARNLEAFQASLAAGVSHIIVDNTNIQPWQFEKYVRAAWAAGYRVREEVVGEFTLAAAQLYAARNTHGVPLDKIMMMRDQWQP